MQLTSGVEIPDGLLAAMPQLAENSRQGFEQITGTMHWASGFVISHTSLGISGPLYDTRTESRYTGKERDTESGLDYFGARYYASTMGRFMSPDFDGDSDDIEPVPYASYSNPQSLNLYSYLRNNPLTHTDPNGHHQECAPDTFDPKTNTLTAGACVEVADHWWQIPSAWLKNVKAKMDANAIAHAAPPQQPSAEQALQNITNVMMGLIPVGGAPGVLQKTLDSIDQTGEAPPGQQGGQEFMNDGRGGGQKLPTTDANGNPIKYQEWDVNPKQPGVNRGGERLVTGSDGSAYSTSDHYQTFTKVR